MRWGRYLGCAVSAVIIVVIAFTLRGEWGKVGESLRGFDPRVLGPAVLLYLCGSPSGPCAGSACSPR